MRFIIHVSIPPEKFNKAVLDGTVSQKMAKILEEAKPEAAYFCAKDGKRGGFLVVNMNSTSEIPRFAASEGPSALFPSRAVDCHQTCNRSAKLNAATELHEVISRCGASVGESANHY